MDIDFGDVLAIRGIYVENVNEFKYINVDQSMLNQSIPSLLIIPI